MFTGEHKLSLIFPPWDEMLIKISWHHIGEFLPLPFIMSHMGGRAIDNISEEEERKENPILQCDMLQSLNRKHYLYLHPSSFVRSHAKGRVIPHVTRERREKGSTNHSLIIPMIKCERESSLMHGQMKDQESNDFSSLTLSSSQSWDEEISNIGK